MVQYSIDGPGDQGDEPDQNYDEYCYFSLPSYKSNAFPLQWGFL